MDICFWCKYFNFNQGAIHSIRDTELSTEISQNIPFPSLPWQCRHNRKYCNMGDHLCAVRLSLVFFTILNHFILHEVLKVISLRINFCTWLDVFVFTIFFRYPVLPRNIQIPIYSIFRCDTISKFGVWEYYLLKLSK